MTKKKESPVTTDENLPNNESNEPVDVRIIPEEFVNALRIYLRTRPLEESENLYYPLINSLRAKAIRNGNQITIV